MVGANDRPVAGRPIAPPALLPLREANGNLVQVLGYEPEFQPDRNKWFVDVAIDPGTALWPFVRLAVARYQPDSLPDCLFTQLSLERTATLSRPDVDHAASSSAARWASVFRRIRSRGGLPQIRPPPPSSSATTGASWRGWEADPAPFRGDTQGDPLTKEWRIVYADHLSL
jgi:hypothetical protein